MADNAEAIKFMNTALPTNRDPRADGAAEIRAVKVALKNSFPNVDKPVTATADQMNNIFLQGMSPGMIVMWSGEEDKVPEGWALCDGKTVGTQITPDLRGKFIMGWNPARSGVEADDVVDIKDKSKLGSHYDEDLSKYLTSEPYALTVAQLPDTSIKFEFDAALDNGENSGGEHYLVPKGGGYRGKIKTDYEFKLGNGDAHTHKLVAAADGKNRFDKRPDWYALAFIMYTGVFKL